MEELIQSINNIAEALKNGTPAWVTIISGLAPIVLTVITIILSMRMNKQNKELQRLIHNRDVKNQSRQDILSIYNAFSEALKTLQLYGTVETIFSHEQSVMFWSQEINNKERDIIKACDKAKLMFSDKDLIDCLLQAMNAYHEICICVSRYVYNGTYLQVLQSAKTSIAAQFGMATNVAAVYLNTASREQLIKMCENENTREITKRIKIYTDLMDDDKFDVKFKKYLEIKELTE